MVIKEFNNLIFPETSEHLRASLVNCGHNIATRGSYMFNGQERGDSEFAIWLYTIAGEGVLKFHDKTIPVRTGQAMLLVVPEDYKYFLPDHSESWEYIYVSVKGAELLRIFEIFRQSHGVVCDFNAESKVVNYAWDIFHQMKNSVPIDAYIASAMAYQFIMSMCASADVQFSTKDEKLVSIIHKYCIDHISQPITVEELAELAGCSRWHFSKRFTQISGYKPHDYIMDIKMRQAVKMLESNLSVKEIVNKIGFSNSAYFCRAFRKAYGVPPGRFRSKAGCTDLEE